MYSNMNAYLYFIYIHIHTHTHTHTHEHVIRETQIKTRWYYTPIRMAKIQNTDHTNRWGRYKATGTLIHCWWECKIVPPLWKTVWQLLTKLNILLPYDLLAITLQGIYPKELKLVHTKNFTKIFKAALFITTKLGSNKDVLQ